MSSYLWKKKHNYYQGLYSKYRTLILDYYGNTCVNCGLYTKLCIDHVYNNGKEDRYNKKHGSGGHGYYKKLWQQIEQGYPDRFQLLCYRCHAEKHSRVI